MKNIKLTCIIIMLISFVVCSFGIYKRVKIEQNYKTYETVMELSEIKAVASVQNKDELDVAHEFLNAGVNTIIVYENTLDNLKINPKFDISVSYSGLDVNVSGNKENLEYIKNAVEKTIKDGRKIYYKDENTITIEGKLSDFTYNSSQIMRDFTGKRITVENNKMSVIEFMGLGYIDSELENLRKNNIKFALRPVYMPMIQDGKKSIDTFIDFLSKYNPDQKSVIFASNDVLGGEENVEYLQSQFEKHSLIPVAIESTTQDGNSDIKGFKKLAKNMNYNTTRLFSTLSYIQDRYDYSMIGHHQGQEIMNTYYRAITERNIRMIYFRVFRFKDGDMISDMDIYKARFNELNARLKKYYNIIPISEEKDLQILPYFDLSNNIKIFAVIGMYMSIILILDVFLKNKKTLLISALILTPSCILVKLKPGLSKVFALIIAISFATLSVIYLMKKIKKIEHEKAEKNNYKSFTKSILILFECIGISFIGSVFLATLYGNSVYLLEFSKFSGVKVSQMLPLLLVVFAYLSIIGIGDFSNYFEFDKEKSIKLQLQETLQKNVKVWQILLGFVMLSVLGIMILRSGHDSNVDPPMSELLLRNILEYITPARPRNKAMFLGYPALMILVILANKKMFRNSYIIFVLAATIGQSNILNTFSHIRTPFIMSLYRILGEYIIAVIITFFIVIAMNIIEKIYKRKKINA